MSYTSEFLVKVVDLLLPGLPADGQHAAIPSASQVGGDRQLAHHLESHPEAEPMSAVLAAIVMKSGGKAAFVAASETEAIALTQAVEQEFAEGFAKLLFVVSADYYESETILQAFGWSAAPPQPQGYPLQPLDESLLNSVKQRGSIWRGV